MNALSAQNVVVEFKQPSGNVLRVLDEVSLSVRPGVIVGLTGPSGRGKTTLGRVMAGLTTPSAGSVHCDGVKVGNARRKSGRAASGCIGMIFQSPRRSFDPRMTLGKSIQLAASRNTHIDALLNDASLTRDLLERFPSQVSDGQLQRAMLVRTLAAQPQYVVMDEMSAMLDPATTATVVHAVRKFAERGGGVLFISHDHELLQLAADEIVAF